MQIKSVIIDIRPRFFIGIYPGIGIVDENGQVLSNPRETYITSPGTGFLPRCTAAHHRSKIVDLVKLVRLKSNLMHQHGCDPNNSRRHFKKRMLCRLKSALYVTQGYQLGITIR